MKQQKLIVFVLMLVVIEDIARIVEPYIVAIELDNFSAGELYSIVAYLWTFVAATEYMPELLENRSSMNDISRRLKQEN